MGTSLCTKCSMEYAWYVRMLRRVHWDIHSALRGCARLAQIEENMVTAFTEVGGADNNRLTVALNRAYYVSRG